MLLCFIQNNYNVHLFSEVMTIINAKVLFFTQATKSFTEKTLISLN